MTAAAPLQTLCRDCFARPDPGALRCASCGSPRILRHAELFDLGVAHMDCDAFYASVEKRDSPEIRDKPVIVGGGKRGVVSTCCYIARINGVRSAMPMGQALRLCPQAVVVKPRMDRYVEVSRQIRAMMDARTPLVEPLSLDEAFLDLRGTERLSGPPAEQLARLAKQVEAALGVTISVGLSHNKFLAKMASDMDKPRGFSVIGKAETMDLLAPMPVSAIWGVGAAGRRKLEREGYRRLSDLRQAEPQRLVALFGAMGLRLSQLARGEDDRPVKRDSKPKSISAETTFEEDIGGAELLEGHLWRLAEKVSDRAKAKGLCGRTVTLKLRQADFRLLTRSATGAAPAQLADEIWRAAGPMLRAELARGPFRLIGVGISGLAPEGQGGGVGDLLDPDAGRRRAVEAASDRIRALYGGDAILKGRALK
ncbi:DNA polymerase IV [Rhodovulum sp. DZ06]|uniref:DNA polymerase IV n=1 Tax=Rhodovulum sp. DZ06 TaxID=3425126 RepID=UPI003D34FFAA